jgi:phytoene synthase
LAAANVSPESVFQGRPEPGLRGVLRSVAARARTLLREARAAHGAVPRAALPALLPARLAERHLARLDAVDFDVFAGLPDANPAATTALLWWAHARGRY